LLLLLLLRMLHLLLRMLHLLLRMLHLLLRMLHLLLLLASSHSLLPLLLLPPPRACPRHISPSSTLQR
jgi:hypothetical protein